MANTLTMKLEQFTRFEQAERQRLDELLTYPTKTDARGEDIIAEGDKVRDIHLVLTGLAARNKILPDGERRIMAFLVPGDLCDVEVFILEALDHNITGLCRSPHSGGWAPVPVFLCLNGKTPLLGGRTAVATRLSRPVHVGGAVCAGCSSGRGGQERAVHPYHWPPRRTCWCL